jgi:hypothetical protein
MNKNGNSNDDQPRERTDDSTRPLPLEAIEPGLQVTQVSNLLPVLVQYRYHNWC